MVNHNDLRVALGKRLVQLPDVERIMTKIYTYSVKSKVKAFYIDAQAMQRLDEFYDLIATLREMSKILKEVFKKATKLDSKRLKALITPRSIIKNQDEEMTLEDEESKVGKSS